MKTESLWTAIQAVMQEVKSIDKSLTVGTGNSAYQGVSDKDVKHIIGQSMAKNNLIMLPVKIEPTTKMERWEESTNYGNKMKQSVFTEVLTTYKLIHTLTGESVELQGYGHGVDSQDKSAGKATTYALKYALLYAFMVPTGQIDDADVTHSNNVATPPPPPAKKQITDELFEKAKEAITSGKTTADKVKATYDIGTTKFLTLKNLEPNGNK